jgi:hypothetical protein
VCSASGTEIRSPVRLFYTKKHAGLLHAMYLEKLQTSAVYKHFTAVNVQSLVASPITQQKFFPLLFFNLTFPNLSRYLLSISYFPARNAHSSTCR